MLTVVSEPADGDRPEAGVPALASLIDEIAREGARRMLAQALQAEVDAYIAQFADERDEHGRRLVVRNGSHQPREVLTSAGAIEVKVPRVDDKRTDPVTGERRRFASAILPPWCRKTPKVTEVLPLLYLHGLSSGDFVPALGQFLGSAAGLSAPVITKLTEQWKSEQRAFAGRDLSNVDYVYLWADGIHVNIRLEEHKLCLLVMIGVRADGRKELIALVDGYRESTESWATCYATANAVACAPRCSRSGTGRWDSGARYARCSPSLASREAGSTRSPMYSGRSRSQRIRLGRDLERRGLRPRAQGSEAIPGRLRRQAPQGRRQDPRRPGRAAGVLRPPGRALGASAHDQPDRVDVRDRAASHQGHQGTRLTGRRPGHGLQAHRIRPGALARRQRTPPRRPCARRSPIRARRPR